MKVVIIGTGNVAAAIGRKIRASEHELVQVAGRSGLHAARIGKDLDVSFVADLTLVSREADLYIVAITDDALPSLAKWLKLDRKLVVHTAGSVTKNILEPVSKNYGVLYPLQSLRIESAYLPDIPLLVDGNTADDLALIKDFASSISDKVEVADDLTRLKIHLAAVMVNNFTNHLYALAEIFCREEQIDFHLFRPLITETANRLNYISAFNAQTGPAIRHDHSTLASHMKILKKYPQLKKIYEEMTRSIQTMYAAAK